MPHIKQAQHFDSSQKYAAPSWLFALMVELNLESELANCLLS